MTLPTGSWDLLSDPNETTFDNFLIAAGVSEAERETMAMVKPSLELSNDGDTWTLKTLSEIGNSEVSFVFGQEVVAPAYCGLIQATSVYTKEGDNKIVQVFQAQGVKGRILREYTADGLVTTLTAEGVTAVRKYKKAR